MKRTVIVPSLKSGDGIDQTGFTTEHSYGKAEEKEKKKKKKKKKKSVHMCPTCGWRLIWMFEYRNLTS